MKNVKKICILKGGDSSEREISLMTAQCFANALDELKYQYVEFDFSGEAFEMVSFINKEKPDCVLNALHGGSGENGNIQAILNLMKIPYTHSGVTASAIGMNKHISKELFAKNGLQIPNSLLVKWKEFIENPHILPYPIVVKPVDGGSSAGVYIIKNVDMISNIHWEYGDHEVLIEEYIPGLELTVGVVCDKSMEVTNILVESGFYDYHNKYSAGGSLHEVPAKIPEKIRQEAMEVALKAHKIIGCRCISRSDFRYNDVSGELYLLELNTQPGMTNMSLFPEQAKCIGISFNELVQIMVEQACYDI